VILWAVHFLAIYGFTGLACARGWHGVLTWSVGGMTLAAALAAGAVIVPAWRRRADFEQGIAAGLAGFALLAILWEGLSVLMVAPCVSR
jgi:hypothetical protein